MQLEIRGKSIMLRGDPHSDRWVLMLTGDHEADALDKRYTMLQQLAPDVSFLLIAIPVSAWQQELSPWPAPPIRGSEGFGDGAQQLLDDIQTRLLPALNDAHGSITDRRLFVCGYSLAGLFALWSVTQTALFYGAAAASPSVWFQGWLDYAKEHACQASHVYLSLGDKEERTRHPILSTVGNAIRTQYELLQAQGVSTTLVWNPGNHFVDADQRLMHGVAWLLRR